MEWIQLIGKILHENNHLWSMMKKSSVSLARKGFRLLRFCVMSWKGESEPNIKCCLAKAVGLVQRFITMQNSGHNWRRADGIRVEYFPRIHHIAARPTKSKSSWTKWATQNNSKDELSSCRCSMTSFGEWKTMSRNVLLIPHLCLYSQKDFQQDVGSKIIDDNTCTFDRWFCARRSIAKVPRTSGKAITTKSCD